MLTTQRVFWVEAAPRPSGNRSFHIPLASIVNAEKRTSLGFKLKTRLELKVATGPDKRPTAGDLSTSQRMRTALPCVKPFVTYSTFCWKCWSCVALHAAWRPSFGLASKSCCLACQRNGLE